MSSNPFYQIIFTIRPTHLEQVLRRGELDRRLEQLAVHVASLICSRDDVVRKHDVPQSQRTVVVARVGEHTNQEGHGLLDLVDVLEFSGLRLGLIHS